MSEIKDAPACITVELKVMCCGACEVSTMVSFELGSLGNGNGRGVLNDGSELSTRVHWH